jgi:hypothetical protein
VPGAERNNHFEPERRFANPLDFQLQLDGWCETPDATGQHRPAA